MKTTNLFLAAAFAAAAASVGATELPRPEVRSVSETRSQKSWVLEYEAPTPTSIAEALGGCRDCAGVDIVSGILAGDPSDGLLPAIPGSRDEGAAMLTVPSGQRPPSVAVVIARVGSDGKGVTILASGPELDLEKNALDRTGAGNGDWLTISSHCFVDATRIDFELHSADETGVSYDVYRRERRVGGGDWTYLATIAGTERLHGHSLFDARPNAAAAGDTEYMVVAKVRMKPKGSFRPWWYVIAVGIEKSDC